MTPITDDQIKHIAAELQTGMLCYLNTKTGELLFVPNEDLIDDTAPWKDAYKKIEDSYSYREIERPGSRDQFIIMEDFAIALPDGKFKQDVFDILDDEKPFRNFKKFIDMSDVRDDWYAFNNQKHIEWVKEEVRTILERREDEQQYP
jgi:glutaredoxin-related protein